MSRPDQVSLGILVAVSGVWAWSLSCFIGIWRARGFDWFPFAMRLIGGCLLAIAVLTLRR